MPQAPIPFVPREESGLGELAGGSPVAHNVVVDSRGSVRRRPGIRVVAPELPATGSPVVGLHRVHAGTVYGIQRMTPAGGLARVFRLNPSETAIATVGDVAMPKRPVLVETEAILGIATGTTIQKVVFDTQDMSTLGNAPRATHILGNSSRLLANDIDDPSRVRYSEFALGSSFAGHESWRGANLFTAEAKPDRVVAVAENTGEIFVWGESSLQVFAPDPQFVYAPVAAREYGCSAPYSPIRRDQAFAWLDHKRRFVLSDGRNYEVLSGPIQQELDSLEVVDDCFGYWVHRGPVDALVWTFPTEQTTLVFHGGAWGRWTGWDTAVNQWAPFLVTAHHQRSDTAASMVGTLDGRLGYLELDAHDDGGTPIHARVETGYLDRGTDARKHCVSVRFVLRRGTGSDGDALFGWRERPGSWEAQIPVRLGPAGDMDIVVEFRSLGVYRRRQWFFDFMGSSNLELASVTEEFEVLEN